MALAICNTTVDEYGRELLQHGTTLFPIACYDDDLLENEVPWHWHEELEAAIVIEGTALVAAGNQKYTIRPGDGFFINSGILHGAWDADLSGCRIHSLVFHSRLVGGSLDSVFYQNYMLPLTENHSLEFVLLSQDIPWQKDALNAIEAAWQNCAYEPPAFEFRVRNELSQFIFLIHNHLSAITGQLNNKLVRNGERSKIMLQYIHEHYAGELNMSLIAQSAAISESECLRCFRTTIGTTPIQYLKQYRLQKAAQLLISTQEHISDIASQCGFQDISYFTKSFRELKNCTPSQYRNKHTAS